MTQPLPPRLSDVVIIGGGLGGLLCAAELSGAGHSVTVVEMAHPGGRARTRLNAGFALDQGPHALYAAGHAMAALKRLGISIDGQLATVDGALIEGGKIVGAMPTSAKSLLFGQALRGRDRLAFGKLMMRLPKIDPTPLMGTPLEEWIAAEGLSGRCAGFVRCLARLTTYCEHPNLSAGAAITQMQVGGAGVYYLDGGWQQLVDKLMALCQAQGVLFQVGRAVRVEAAEGAEVVHLAEGQQIKGRSVVVAAGPRTAQRLFERPRVNAEPIRAACLAVGVKRLPTKTLFAMALDAPHYFSVASRSSDVAPAGGALVHIARYLSPDYVVESGAMRAELEAVFDAAQPGWQTHKVVDQLLPKMVVSHWTPTAATNGFLGRPATKVSDTRHLVGDWVGAEGHLLDASAASAHTVAQHLLRLWAE